MELFRYAKRAADEIIRPTHSVVALLVVAVVLVGIVTLNVVAWTRDRTEDTPPEQATAATCAFRVTEEGKPMPVTEGDGAQLNTCVELEVVTSDSRRVLGLSNRPSLPWNRAMLFVFEKPAQYCMWMKDMRFSLDIIWLNERNEIVATKENVSPQTFPKSFCGPETAQYVIEANAGIVRAGDLRLGQRIAL